MLRERGLIIEGAEPETVLSTMLWRMRDAAKIVHLKNVGYWTAEARWPPAHYIPNEKAEPKENDPLSSDRRERELDDMTAKLEEALKRPFAPYKA